MLHKPDERRTTSPPRLRAAAVWWAVLVVLVGAYAWYAAGTTPFTTGANLTVGAALVVAAALAATEATTGRPWRARHRDRTGPEGSLWPWWVAIAVLVGWELFNYFQGPRHDYPTISSIYDHVARWQWAKAALIAAWLVLGWEIVASFAKDHQGQRDDRDRVSGEDRAEAGAWPEERSRR
jgi:hypothetical protein